MIYLDTSVLVALIAQDDSLHTRAVKTIEKLSGTFCLHEYVYIETLSVLATRYGMYATEKFLSYLTQGQALEFCYAENFNLKDITLLFREQSNGKLSFVDATLLYLSTDHDIVTFDKALAMAIKKRGGKPIK